MEGSKRGRGVEGRGRGMKKWKGMNIALVIQDEIYDMVKPADPLHITLQDLITRYDLMTVHN